MSSTRHLVEAPFGDQPQRHVLEGLAGREFLALAPARLDAKDVGGHGARLTW
jgi:hypothetical protein